MAELLPTCDPSFDSGDALWHCPKCGKVSESYRAGRLAFCGFGATPTPGPLAVSMSDEEAGEPPKGVGRVTRAPDGQSLRVELTPEEVAHVSNMIIDALRAASLQPTTQLWISMLMLASAHLHALGVSHTEAMQLLTVGWNGEETGILKIRAREG